MVIVIVMLIVLFMFFISNDSLVEYSSKIIRGFLNCLRNCNYNGLGLV